MVAIAAQEICTRPASIGENGNAHGYSLLPIAALQSEGSITNVPAEDVSARVALVAKLRMLPSEALANIRHFQTQIGCLNRCGFCSQGAGKTIWNMPRRALGNLISALKTVCLEHAVTQGLVRAKPLNEDHIFSADFEMPKFGILGHQRRDRPGVIYCYLDNDPAAYPHLDDLIKWLHEDLGVKVRIATVGYSRHNVAIQQMHERISENLIAGIAGLRLSISPYTYGWTAGAVVKGEGCRDEFERDVARLLSTYRNLFLSRKGRKDACVELRFRPLVVTSPVDVVEANGRLTIRCGSYLVVQAQAEQLNIATITDAKSHSNCLSAAGNKCLVVRAPAALLKQHHQALVMALESGSPLPFKPHSVYTGLLHRLQNEDGEYFSIDAEKRADGVYSKFFYPKVGYRPGAGMIDGERYHLNALLEARSLGNHSTWEHVDALLNRMLDKATSLEHVDAIAAQYIRVEMVDLLQSYVRMLKIAHFPSSAYFDKERTVDTGHICNLGRAYHEYKAIASRPDLPLTPNHERAFGTNGELAEEGIAWRLAVAPLDSTRNSRGERNLHQKEPSILIEKLDLAMTATRSGQSQARYFMRTDVVEKITLHDSAKFPVIPGHISRLSA